MTLCEKKELALAETCIGLMESVPRTSWEHLYEMYKEQLGGFPGLRSLVAKWALRFFHHEPDAGVTFEYIAALDKFAADVCAYAENAGLPDQNTVDEIAKKAIDEFRY